MGRWSSRSQLWFLSLALPVLVVLFGSATRFGGPFEGPIPEAAQGTPAPMGAVASPQTFATGYTVEGVFLDYWARYGGLMRSGCR
ncbi:MAG: hypothetical protein U0841_17160 [Chloroflexia bacterium]